MYGKRVAVVEFIRVSPDERRKSVFQSLEKLRQNANSERLSCEIVLRTHIHQKFFLAGLGGAFDKPDTAVQKPFRIVVFETDDFVAGLGKRAGALKKLAHSLVIRAARAVEANEKLIGGRYHVGIDLFALDDLAFAIRAETEAFSLADEHRQPENGIVRSFP